MFSLLHSLHITKRQGLAPLRLWKDNAQLPNVGYFLREEESGFQTV
jgi:hypothetical protein